MATSHGNEMSQSRKKSLLSMENAIKHSFYTTESLFSHFLIWTNKMFYVKIQFSVLNLPTPLFFVHSWYQNMILIKNLNENTKKVSKMHEMVRKDKNHSKNELLCTFSLRKTMYIMYLNAN